MDKYRNKYRIPSTRLQNWDYGWNAAYFITICTDHHTCFFGDIMEGAMYLSNIGVLADVFWHEIKHHAQNIELGDFVVMPNHVHGILVLNGNDAAERPSGNEIPDKTIGQRRFQNQGRNSISSIVGAYKSAVSKHAHRLGFDFEWQDKFYEHIIRDDEDFQRIHYYIINDPSNWSVDKFHVYR